MLTLGPRTVAIVCALPLAGCMAYSNADFDVDRTPIVNVGSRASIIYPGQSGPGFPEFQPQATPGQAGGQNPTAQPPQAGDPAELPPGQQPTSGAAPSQGSAYQQPTDPNAGMMLLGGAREDITRHMTIREDPLFMKYLTAPLAVLAAPFVLGKEALQGETTPGPAIPRAPDPQAPVAPPQSEPMTYEQQMLRQMERELAQRGDAPTQSNANPDVGARSGATQHASLSIADELDALQRVSEAPRPEKPRPAVASEPARGATGAPTGDGKAPADGIVDRNGDERIDQWIYRHGGEIVREELDEDFDGRVDRIVHIDLESHSVSLVEEDIAGDGVIDTWTDYRNGAVARRRSDSDADGAVDTWSFYRDGELARHEQDTTHDGYRDAISFYVKGRRVRETRDLDVDGRPDTEVFFDAEERITRQQEDRDGDGFAEVVSHYTEGRLVRRELLDAPELASQQTGPTGAAIR